MGQSAYSQHLKICQGQGNNSEVSADKYMTCKWEPRGKRILFLELTDGTQVNQTMEYMPINALHFNMIPGTTMLIKGPVEYHYSVLLLQTQ